MQRSHPTWGHVIGPMYARLDGREGPGHLNCLWGGQGAYVATPLRAPHSEPIIGRVSSLLTRNLEQQVWAHEEHNNFMRALCAIGVKFGLEQARVAPCIFPLPYRIGESDLRLPANHVEGKVGMLFARNVV